jgi:hypothetical protein
MLIEKDFFSVQCDISTKINDLETGIWNEIYYFTFHLLEILLDWVWNLHTCLVCLLGVRITLTLPFGTCNIPFGMWQNKEINTTIESCISKLILWHLLNLLFQHSCLFFPFYLASLSSLLHLITWSSGRGGNECGPILPYPHVKLKLVLWLLEVVKPIGAWWCFNLNFDN